MAKYSTPERPKCVKAAAPAVDERLLKLLSHATCHGNEHVLTKYMPNGYYKDPIGNFWYFKGKTSEHRTMFSCHMDTVHMATTTTVIPVIDPKTCLVYAETSIGQPMVLGADDKVGMYIMFRLMEADVPGIYCFHAGEEKGGIGSSWIAKNKPSMLKNIDRCVAFDRRGYTDIITHQFDRCCSDDFATALAGQLNINMPPSSQFKPDNTGVFTDSANYTDLIAECTNLSVGYFNEHTSNEHFDVYWLDNMFIPALLEVDWAKLPTVRKPGESDYDYGYSLATKAGRKDYRKDQKALYAVDNAYGHYDDMPYDKWKYLTAATSWDRLPVLSPLDDYPESAISTRLVEKAMEKYLISKGSTFASEEIVKLMQYVADLEEENGDLKQTLKDKETLIDEQDLTITDMKLTLRQAEYMLVDADGKPLMIQ